MAAIPPPPAGSTMRTATRPVKHLPENLIKKAQATQRVSFDAKKHVNFEYPNRIFSMDEIGLGGQGISPTAASEPFALFTPEAIQQMRAEIFSDAVLEKCQYSSEFATNMIRGFGPALAPFIFDAWNSPEILDAVSQIAGVDLVPAIDFDVGHINISINDGNSETVSKQQDPEEEQEKMSAFGWHKDSFPFVCVTMLSDCAGMIGGETVIKTGNNDFMKIRGPAMGTAVVMQGRYIEHQALKALGGRERISMVTSFRPRSIHVKDEVVLTGVRAISNVSELYNQYTLYRLEVLEERIRTALKRTRDRQRGNRPFDMAGTIDFITEQKLYLEAMLNELL